VRDGIQESSHIICRSRGLFIVSFVDRSLVDFTIGNGNSIAHRAHFQLENRSLVDFPIGCEKALRSGIHLE